MRELISVDLTRATNSNGHRGVGDVDECTRQGDSIRDQLGKQNSPQELQWREFNIRNFLQRWEKS